MDDETKLFVLRLRMVIGFLGERTQFNWWTTGFFESSSNFFLEPIYTKTSALAQYHGVVEAARRVHDEHLNVGSYHLFRLPEEVEHALHVLVPTKIEDDLICDAFKSKKNALESLKNLAGSNTMTGEGPVVVGKIEDLGSIKALQKTAVAYLMAFEENVKAYPYFMR